MYRDVISYKLAEGVTLEDLKSVAEKVYEDWMKLQEGFICWEITERADGGLTDIVCWKSREAAKAAEESMATMPQAKEWMGCYDPKSINTINLNSKVSFQSCC